MTHLLQIRKANSFEQSTFLVSLLLGLGYDAYVVSGYASRETTFCNQRMLPCPDLSTAEEPPSPEPEVVVPKYRPTSPPTFRSRFLDGLEARKRDRDEQETRQRVEERQRLITVRPETRVESRLSRSADQNYVPLLHDEGARAAAPGPTLRPASPRVGARPAERRARRR